MQAAQPVQLAVMTAILAMVETMFSCTASTYPSADPHASNKLLKPLTKVLERTESAEDKVQDAGVKLSEVNLARQVHATTTRSAVTVAINSCICSRRSRTSRI